MAAGPRCIVGTTLQGPCGRSPKRRGSLRFLPPLEVRPSSVAPDPADLGARDPLHLLSLTFSSDIPASELHDGLLTSCLTPSKPSINTGHGCYCSSELRDAACGLLIWPHTQHNFQGESKEVGSMKQPGRQPMLTSHPTAGLWGDCPQLLHLLF